MLIEKSRECHNYKSQPTLNAENDKTEHVQNKQTNAREAHRPAPSSPSKVVTMLKVMTKHEDKDKPNIWAATWQD